MNLKLMNEPGHGMMLVDASAIDDHGNGLVCAFSHNSGAFVCYHFLQGKPKKEYSVDCTCPYSEKHTDLERLSDMALLYYTWLQEISCQLTSVYRNDFEHYETWLEIERDIMMQHKGFVEALSVMGLRENLIIRPGVLKVSVSSGQ